MLANWVQESTPTTGTGTTISLGGAAAGYVPVSARLSDGQSSTFIFTDGNNRQVAICTYNVTGNTLTINTLLEQLVAGVLTLNPATPMSLSGSATVSMDSVATSNVNGYRAGFALSIAGTQMIDWGESGQGGTSLATGGVPTANDLSLIDFVCTNPTLVSTLVFWVQTADAAATNTRLGLWAVNSSGGPGILLFDSGDVSSLMGTTGIKTVALAKPVLVNPGCYYKGYTSSSITAKLGFAWPQIGWSSSISGRQSLRVASVTGALTSNPTPTAVGGQFPCYGWK